MTNCQKNALGRDVMTASDVEDHYEVYQRGFSSSPAASIVRRLCESHERLRMEMEGSAVLHDESAKAIRQAADDMKRMRDGLLRIFARAPDWSGECVQANVADLLGMTVQEVQAEIDIDTTEG